MRRLTNPYSVLPGYFCFGCSPDNHKGLQMNFVEDGEEIVCTWEPSSHYQGYINILHGGVQSTLMDEIASWVVFIKLNTGGVTSRLTTRFKKPVKINEGPVTIRARLREVKRNIAVIGVKLFDAKGTLCAESLAEYFLLSEEKAREQMNFPGREAFYK